MRIQLPDGREMNARLRHDVTGRYTTAFVEMAIYPDQPHRVRYEGAARCSKNDQFDRKIGRKVAAERVLREMRGAEPKEVRRLAFEALVTPEKFKKPKEEARVE